MNIYKSLFRKLRSLDILSYCFRTNTSHTLSRVFLYSLFIGSSYASDLVAQELVVANPDPEISKPANLQMPTNHRQSTAIPKKASGNLMSFGTVALSDDTHDLSTDTDALIALYNSTGGPAWTNRTNWLTGSVETWYGVTVTDNRVTSLILNGNHLVGSLPVSIGELTALVQLHLYANTISLGIPASIGNLIQLDQLLLFDNPLGGEIPASIGNLASLSWLYIYRNNLIGDLPQSLGDLTNLKRIAFHQNNLTGNLDWTSNLVNLNQLYFHNNPNLNCQLPVDIGNLVDLTRVIGYNTKLFGSIPASLNECTSLQLLYLHGNSLSGDLPYLGSLINLTNFWIHYNYSITGTLPSWITNLTKIQILSIGDTGLSGSLPSNIGNLTALKELYIQNSQISGVLPATLVNVTNLAIVDMKGMNLNVMPSMLNSFSKMKNLIFSNNNLTDISNFTSHTNRNNLVYDVSNNQLDFSDLEPHFTGVGITPYKTFTYTPQQNIETSLPTQQTYNWHVLTTNNRLEVTVAGARNIYQWQKNEGANNWLDLVGKTASQLIFNSISVSDAGEYRLKITNQWVTGLSLYSKSFIVEVTSGLCNNIYCLEAGVGIGTQILASGYGLTVKGKIMTEGARVNSSTKWPDYVFDPNYNLLSLPELKKFISANRHLPNIPSSQTVLHNGGIDAGEMSTLLLQKTEELTLHFIKLNDRLMKLEKEGAKRGNE